MKMKFKMANLVGLIVLMAAAAWGTVSVKVFSLEEVLTGTNMSQPRVYLQNTGTESLTGLSYYYYFETEDGKVPSHYDYYTPDEDVTLEPVSGNLYRMKYTITRTVNSNEIVPNTSGNVISIQYNDWSPWDKTNDFSNNLSSSFLENQKIAVYLNGTRIYGTEPTDTPDDPSDPPVDPPQPANIALQSFALFSTEESMVRDQSVFSGGGAVGSNNYVEIGAGASITGNVISGGNALLRSNAVITGNVMVNGEVTTQDGVSVGGSIQESAGVAAISLPVRTITPGTEDKNIYSGTMSLAPGIYRDLNVFTNATLNLSPGNYVFNNFLLQPGAHIVFNTSMTQQIEIDVQGEFQVSDGATMQFSGFSYAPAVQIYTNDQNTISIGCDSRIAGIITAPNATVNIYSRAQYDGAIYAKRITTEPGSRIISSLVDPEGDADLDGLRNYTEVFETGTDPLNAASYKEIAIPSPALIENTSDVNVVYDVSRFYEDYSHGNLIFNFRANSLTRTHVAPALYMSNTPYDVVTLEAIPAPDFQGFDIVGRYLLMDEDAMRTNGTALAGVLLPRDEIAEPEMYSVAVYSKESGWRNVSLTTFSEENPYNLFIETGKFSAIVILKLKNMTATAYLDHGMIFSSNGGESKIKTDIRIKNCPAASVSGYFRITYRDYADPSNPVEKPPLQIDLQKTSGSNNWQGSKNFSFSNPVEVIRTELYLSGSDLNYSRNVSYSIARGECLYMFADQNYLDYMRSGEQINVSKVTGFDLESVDMDGEGRIYQISESVFKYDYYMKDHLGSTRMVISDDDKVTEAIAYQPYGNMVPLTDIATTTQIATRQQFTGKEFDREGVSADFCRFEVRVEIDVPAGEYQGIVIADLDDNTSDGRYFAYEASSGKLISCFNVIRSENINLTGLSVQIKNLSTSAVVDYRVEDLSYEVTPGYKRNLDLLRDLSEIESAAGTNANIWVLNDPEQVYENRMALNYFGARYYDPETGVWISVDPAEQYWSPYIYCGGNPVIIIDPNGEMGWFTWGIDKDGLSIGWQFPNGTGFYSRFGWKDNFSYSTGVTLGYNASLGNSGASVGVGAQLGTTWTPKTNEWSQDGSVGVNVGYGGGNGGGAGLSLGASLNLSYSYNHNSWTPGWGTNLGATAYGGTFGCNVGYGGDFQGNNGWTWGANGSALIEATDFGYSKNSVPTVQIEDAPIGYIDPNNQVAGGKGLHFDFTNAGEKLIHIIDKKLGSWRFNRAGKVVEHSGKVLQEKPSGPAAKALRYLKSVKPGFFTTGRTIIIVPMPLIEQLLNPYSRYGIPDVSMNNK